MNKKVLRNITLIIGALAAVTALFTVYLMREEDLFPMHLPVPTAAETAAHSVKAPASYSWAEYEALSPAEKEQFFDSFGSVEAFDAWLQSVTTQAPWENGGKTPDTYTWAEYEALGPAWKEQFFDWFDSAEAFDAWMTEATAQDSRLPWENGGKAPASYSWAEYEALSPAQKEAFFDSFDSMAAFDAWMNSVGGAQTSANPWENGGKAPASYSWAEYEALEPAQKDAFFDSFESVEAFDVWLRSVTVRAPWENGGKAPDSYTWAEYEALSPAQKEQFFDSFGSLEAFQAWMDRVNPG